MSKIQEIATAVENGKTKIVAGLVQEALNEGIAAQEILNVGMIQAMDVVGAKFGRGDIFVPEMLIAAKAMKNGVEVLKPKLAAAGSSSLGKVVIGTVIGDLHDIGKNLVAMMIESAGFEVKDLGVDVPVDKFVEAVDSDSEVKIMAVSALLTTTMPAMKDTVDALNASKNRARFKILVGGAPITQDFANQIKADSYAPDAASAAKAAKALIA
ncbi:MAG: corrinoid protein [Acidobacteriota bacterium]|jgi:corrinoid protein of di/trimethylamine methyltransferase|nr:corrinoid protein [Acidobacteriota bacterium]